MMVLQAVLEEWRLCTLFHVKLDYKNSKSEAGSWVDFRFSWVFRNLVSITGDWQPATIKPRTQIEILIFITLTVNDRHQNLGFSEHQQLTEVSVLLQEFMKKLEAKRTELNKATGMGDALLAICHPDSITTIKHWITIIQARFEEVSVCYLISVWQWLWVRAGKWDILAAEVQCGCGKWGLHRKAPCHAPLTQPLKWLQKLQDLQLWPWGLKRQMFGSL